MKAIRKIKENSSSTNPKPSSSSTSFKKNNNLQEYEDDMIEEVNVTKFSPLSFPENPGSLNRPSININYNDKEIDKELQLEKKMKKKKKSEKNESSSSSSTTSLINNNFNIDTSPSIASNHLNNSLPISTNTTSASSYYIPDKLFSNTKEEEILLNNRRYALLFSFGLWGPSGSTGLSFTPPSTSTYSSSSSSLTSSLFSLTSTLPSPASFLPSTSFYTSSSSLSLKESLIINFDLSLIIHILDKEFLLYFQKLCYLYNKKINFIIMNNNKNIINLKNFILLNSTIGSLIFQLTLINTTKLNYHDDVKELLKGNTILQEIELNNLGWLTDKFFIQLISNHFLVKISKFDTNMKINSANPHLNLPPSPTKGSSIKKDENIPSNYLMKLNLNSLLNLTHYAFFPILKQFLKVTEIIFINCPLINDMCMLEMSKEIKTLQKLVIKHNNYITNNSIIKLIENNSSELIELILHDCLLITDELFTSFTLLQSENFVVKEFDVEKDQKVPEHPSSDSNEIYERRKKNNQKYENLNKLNKKKNSFKIIKKVELMHNNNLLNMNSILFIATSCVYLKELVLLDCNNLNIINVLKELMNLNLLEVLKISLPSLTSSKNNSTNNSLMNTITFTVEKNPLKNLSKLDMLKHKKQLMESLKKDKKNKEIVEDACLNKIQYQDIHYKSSLDDAIDYDVFTYYLSMIMKQNPNILDLQLFNFYSLSDKNIGFILDNVLNKNFHTLKVKNLLNFSVNSVEGLVNNGKTNLKVLSINNSLKFFGNCLKFIINHNKSLISLSLNHCNLLTNYDFSRLFYLNSLKKLNLNYCSPLINEDIFKNFKDLVSLEELSMENFRFSNEYYQNFQTFLSNPSTTSPSTFFSSLFIHFNPIIFYNLKVLNFSNLQNFNFHFIINIFEMFPNLNCLNLTLNFSSKDEKDLTKKKRKTITDKNYGTDENKFFLYNPIEKINYDDLLNLKIFHPFLNLVISSDFAGYLLFHPNQSASISPSLLFSDYNILADKLSKIIFPQSYEDMLIDKSKIETKSNDKKINFKVEQGEDESTFVIFPLEINSNFYQFSEYSESNSLFDSSLYFNYSSNIIDNISKFRKNELLENQKLKKFKELENNLKKNTSSLENDEIFKSNELLYNESIINNNSSSSYNDKNIYFLSKNFFLFNSRINGLKRRIRKFLEFQRLQRDSLLINKNKEEKWKLLKNHSVIVIQSFFRMVQKKKAYKGTMRKVHIIQRLVKKFIDYQYDQKYKYYLSIYNLNLLRKCINHMRIIQVENNEIFKENCMIINTKKKFFTLLNYFRLWQQKQDDLKEAYYNQISFNFFSYNLLSKVINSWKKIIKNKELLNYNELNLFNIKKFFILIDFSFYNSSRQQELIELSHHFYVNLLLTKSFDVLSKKIKDNRDRNNRNAQLINGFLVKNQAKKFGLAKKLLLANLKYLIKYKRYKKSLLKRLLFYKKLLILKRLKKYASKMINFKNNILKFDYYYSIKMKELIFNVFLQNSFLNIKFKRKFNYVMKKLNEFHIKRNFILLKSNIVKMKNDRIMEVTVVRKYEKKLKYKYFNNIKLYVQLNASGDTQDDAFEIVYYHKKLLKKFFNELLENKNKNLKVKNDLISIIKKKLIKEYNEDLLENNKKLYLDLLNTKIYNEKLRLFQEFLNQFHMRKEEKIKIKKIKLLQQRELEEFNQKLSQESLEGISQDSVVIDGEIEEQASTEVKEIEYIDSDDFTDEFVDVDEEIEEQISLSEYEKELQLLKEKNESSPEEIQDENLHMENSNIPSEINLIDQKDDDQNNNFNKTIDINSIEIVEGIDNMENSDQKISDTPFSSRKTNSQPTSSRKSTSPLNSSRNTLSKSSPRFVLRKRIVTKKELRKRIRTKEEIEEKLKTEFFNVYNKIHPLNKISPIFAKIALSHQRPSTSPLRKKSIVPQGSNLLGEGEDEDEDEDEEEDEEEDENEDETENETENETEVEAENETEVEAENEAEVEAEYDAEDENENEIQENIIKVMSNEIGDVNDAIEKINEIENKIECENELNKQDDHVNMLNREPKSYYANYFPKVPSPISTPIGSPENSPSSSPRSNEHHLPQAFQLIRVNEIIPDDLDQKVKKILNSIVKVQAIIRKILIKGKIHDMRINKIYYILVLQKFGRFIIAKRKVKNLLKLKKIEELLREENENKLMNACDMEMKEYSFIYSQIVLIQKVFRGFRGRNRARHIRTAHYLQKAKDEAHAIQHLKDHHQAYKRAQMAKELLKVRCVIQIQKIVRGKIARNLYKKLKLNKLISTHAVCVQRSYKRRMAVLKLEAMKRDVNNQNRFDTAKQKRGSLFRFFGINKRATQEKIIHALDALGLDPLSFHYSLKEIWKETKEDYKIFIDTVKREYNLLKKNKFNIFNLNFHVDKRNELINEGYKFKVQDTVRIIDQENKYYGLTGRIVRIDETILGKPLVEVLLDRYNIITTLRMSTDPLQIYMKNSLITRVPPVPDTIEHKNKFRIFPHSRKLNSKLVTKKKIFAAWTIQRAYRCYYSRKIAVRLRYEKWQENIKRQWQLYYQLSEFNALNLHGFNVTKLFNTHAHSLVYFDEISHPFYPSKLKQIIKKKNEDKEIKRELNARYKDRQTYLQKSLLLRNKDNYTIGTERLTFFRKLSFFFKSSFNVFLARASSPSSITSSTTALKIRDIRGSNGIKFLNQKGTVTGTDAFFLPSLKNSPHVRYYLTTLYQGEWSGIPFITSLKPHGEGLLMFLDAWGFVKEDKVLYLSILKCNNLLTMDANSSDPYCSIFCNDFNVQTSIKYKNLNPEYYESFEIDVTNPQAVVNIQVKDYDILSSDDFIGQVSLPVSNYSNDEEYTLKLNLLNEELKYDYNRGSIEIRIRWSEKKNEDDDRKLMKELKSIIRIQSWYREIKSLRIKKKLLQDYKDNMVLVKKSAIIITSLCRVRIAKKKYKLLLRTLKSCIKIQKRIRIYIAKKIFKEKKVLKTIAIRIQRITRVYLAKLKVFRMKEERAKNLYRCATVIQKYARKYLAYTKYREIIEEREEELLKVEKRNKKNGIVVKRKKVNIHEWLPTYGRDEEYGLRRNRRIVFRLFHKLITLKYYPVNTYNHGIFYVLSHPPVKTEEEILLELQGSKIEYPFPREEYISLFLPTFDTKVTHRKDVIKNCESSPFYTITHINTSIDIRKTVFNVVIVIQNFFRQYLARKARNKLIRINKAFSIFQLKFRERYFKIYKAAIIVTNFVRLMRDFKYAKELRRERDSAQIIQNNWRIYLAKTAAFNLRSVELISIISFSPEPLSETNGPHNIFQHTSETFWVSKTTDHSTVKVEFFKQESIVEIWIMPCMNEASPLYFSCSYLKNKEDKHYETAIHKKELPLLKNNQWFKISLEHNITSKYFIIDFYDNYGDENYTSLKQIRFIRSKEKSVEIIQEPNHFILNPGPMINEEYEVVLKCDAVGWPLPTFQWYYGDIPIENATKNELRLILKCEAQGERTYRCARCKMIGTNVPNNAYHTECGNCNYLFTNKDIEFYDNLITQINKDEEELSATRMNLISSKIQIENFNNLSKYKNIINDFNERIEDCNQKILNLYHKKFLLKRKVHVVNNYTNEGIYTCKVTNIRGGTMKLTKKSLSVVVVVEKPRPFWVDVVPFYQPRPQTIRKKWNFYSSIYGTFTKGRIDGLVLIKYTDGSIYEGPYVPEDLIDNMGRTHRMSRLPDHYGVYKLPDGRIFEGENVDNHFDPFNLQEFYRLKLVNKEVYEGKFCDEQFHGIGIYKYIDGSIYEGQWHRGTRFGHGHFRSSAGWTYEGFFDKDRRHRKGIIDWPDNSSYMGNWYYGIIKGNGIFISTLRDIYRGEFNDGKFNGQGELVYSDGSFYIGNFKDGLRHGKGIFTSKNGDEYYGHYENDQKIGEHVVKIIIPIEEPDQNNYEIRIGVYVNGNLSYWKSKFSNPIATKQFVNMFRSSRDMFDSVYSMILAKHLPNLPEGIDPNNKYVRQIIMKIRSEAGMLVGQQALLQAQNQCTKLLEPIEEKKNTIISLKNTIESLSMKIINLEKESNILLTKHLNLLSKYEKDSLKIEQYWLDEPKHVRFLFQEACKKLDEISVDDYFTFRNHRIVPLFVTKIFNAISYLLNLPIDWKQQQLLVSDSATNARSGDEEALRLNYDCKLSYLMKDYKVFNYVPLNLPDEFIEIISDVRFRMDSYYVSSLGTPGPVLVNWIKTNYAYLKSANTIYQQLNAAEDKKLESYRYKAQYNKKMDEILEYQEKLSLVKEELKKNEYELHDLNHALLKAKDLLEFIEGRFNTGTVNVKRDYYKLLEEKLEKKRDYFNIEVCLQSIIDTVIDNHEKEQKTLKLQAFAMGKPYVEPKLIQYKIMDWIEEEVDSQQESILKSNRTLGYYHEKKPTDVTKAYTNQIISLIVDIIIGKLNDQYNEFASARSWINLKGRRFNSRFLYIKAWQVWEKKAIEIRNREAIAAWQEIFNNNEMLMATMAIESKVNHRMSSIARFQAKIWANYHKELIKEAELQLSESFHSKYDGDLEKLCEEAYKIEQDWQTDEVNPSLKASCLCWINLHYNEMQEYRNLKALEKAEKFANFYGDKAPVKAFQLLNGLLNFEEASSGASNATTGTPSKVVNTTQLNNWIEYASYWKEFNVKEYEEGGDALLKDYTKQFVDLYPLASYYEAAKLIINKKLSELIPNELAKREYLPAVPNHLLLAYSYGLKNQGLLRKGKEMYHEENDKQMYKLWTELINFTNNFTKNSYYLTQQIQNQLNEFDIRNEESESSGLKEESDIKEVEEHEEEEHEDIEDTNDKNISTNKGTLKILSNLKNYNKATLSNLIKKTSEYRTQIINQQKFSWLYGYISYKCDLLYQELYNLSCNDPINKQFHDIRPSEAVKFRMNVEEEFISKKKKLSSQYTDVITRLTAFNNFLGWETKFERDIEKIDYNYLNNQ